MAELTGGWKAIDDGDGNTMYVNSLTGENTYNYSPTMAVDVKDVWETLGKAMSRYDSTLTRAPSDREYKAYKAIKEGTVEWGNKKINVDQYGWATLDGGERINILTDNLVPAGEEITADTIGNPQPDKGGSWWTEWGRPVATGLGYMVGGSAALSGLAGLGAAGAAGAGSAGTGAAAAAGTEGFLGLGGAAGSGLAGGVAPSAASLAAGAAGGGIAGGGAAAVGAGGAGTIGAGGGYAAELAPLVADSPLAPAAAGIGGAGGVAGTGLTSAQLAAAAAAKQAAGWTVQNIIGAISAGTLLASTVAAIADGVDKSTSATTTTEVEGPGKETFPGTDKTIGEKTLFDFIDNFYGLNDIKPAKQRIEENVAGQIANEQTWVDTQKGLDTQRLTDTKAVSAPYQQQLSDQLAASQQGTGLYKPIGLSFGGNPITSFVPKQNMAQAGNELNLGRENASIGAGLVDMGYNADTGIAGRQLQFSSAHPVNEAQDTYSNKLEQLMNTFNPQGQTQTTTGTVPGTPWYTTALQGMNTGVNLYNSIYNPRQSNSDALLAMLAKNQGGT